MKKLLMALAVAVTTVVTQTAQAATVAITGYDPSTRQVSLAFSGLERGMSLVAVVDSTDKGTEDFSKWATPIFVGSVDASATTLTWDLPASVDAMRNAVRFALLDLNGAKPVSYIQNSGNAYINTIDTGYYPSYNDTVDFKVTPGTSGCWIFDARDYNLVNRFSALIAADLQLRVDRGEKPYYSKVALSSAKNYQIAVDYKNKTVKIDGEPWKGGLLDYGTDGKKMVDSLLLFASRYQGAISYAGGAIKLFYLRLTDSTGVVKMELLPCVKGETVGFVDRISHKFMANVGEAGSSLAASAAVDLSAAKSAVIASTSLLRDATRKVSVVSLDEKTGFVSLSFTATGTSNILYVAKADYDRGQDSNLWPGIQFLAAIPAEMTSLTCQLPADLFQGQGSLRFFLTSWSEGAILATEVTSLTNDGEAWINTGVKPDGTTSISVVHQQIKPDACVFGIQGCFYFFNNNAAQPPFYFFGYGDLPGGNNGNLGAAYFPGQKRTMSLGPDGAYINDTRVSPSGFAGATMPETAGIALFCRVSQDGKSVDKKGTCTIYSAVITKGGETVCDLVPCVKDGVAQMYDRITGEFLTNRGSGAFTPGEVVSAKIADVVSSASIGVGCPAISFSVPSASTIKVRLGANTGKGVLYAVCDVEDRGTDLSSWANRIRLGEVSAADETREISYNVPSDWRTGKAKCCRVFYVASLSDSMDYEAESLTNDGKAWINTGVNPDTTTSISVVHQQIKPDACVFGITGIFNFFNSSADSQNPFYFFAFGTKSGQKGLGGAYFPGAKRTMKFGPDGAYIDDACIFPATEFAGAEMPETKGIALFCRVDSTGATISKEGACTIYSAEITKGGQVVRDLVPYVKNGVAQMYDRVTGEFLSNSGAGAFTAGAPKELPAEDLVIGCSPCRLAGMGLFIVVK